jgi:hypothetical protein
MAVAEGAQGMCTQCVSAEQEQGGTYALHV